MVEDAIERLFFGWDKDTLQYDVTFSFAPTPEGVQPAYIVPIVAPSPLMGQHLINFCIIVNWANASQKDIDEIIVQAVEKMNDGKRQALSFQNGGKKHGR
jgi:hypothetical protein